MDASLMKIMAENCVLAVIDVQDKMMRAMNDKIAERTIKNIMILLKLAEVYEIPVIITEQYPKGLGATLETIKNAIKKYPVIEKQVFSSAEVPEFQKTLAATGRKNVIITGVETHVCIYQTTRDLIVEGYRVITPEDAVCSRTKQNWLRGISLCQEAGALITSTEALSFDIMYQAGTPKFKELSPFFK